ncbi:hypothetical protein R6Q57_004540 [Mikania cordata]
MNFQSFSCSFRLFSKPNDDQESNLRSQSFSHDSFNSSFSSKSSLPSSISAVTAPSTTHHHCIFTIKPNSSHILSLILAGNHLFTGSSNSQIHRWPRHPTTTSSEQSNIPNNVSVKAELLLGSDEDESVTNLSCFLKDKEVVPTNTAFTSNTSVASELLVKFEDGKMKTNISCVSRNRESTSNQTGIIISDEENISTPTKSAVKCVQILNDNTLISAHQDHKIKIWKIDNHHIKLVTTLPTLKDRLTKVLFAKNYVKVRRHKKLAWIHHNDAVSSLAVSTDKSLIYSGSWDRSFKVWRTSDYKCLESVSDAHDDAINAIVLSDEGFVYTGSADKKIKVWRFDEKDRKHELIDTLVHHKSSVNALAYEDRLFVLISGACSGVMIASERNFSGAGEDGDGGHMVVVGALLGHKKAILCVRIVGELVCSGSADKTVRLWRRSVGKSYSCVGVLEGHGGPVKCLAVAVESSGDGDGREYLV